MPAVPTATPDREKIRKLIWDRGYTITDFARKIGLQPQSVWEITGRTPKPVGISKYLRPIARGLRVRVSDISDWAGDEDDVWSGAETKIPA